MFSVFGKHNYKAVVTSVVEANRSAVEFNEDGRKREFLRYYCPKKGCPEFLAFF